MISVSSNFLKLTLLFLTLFSIESLFIKEDHLKARHDLVEKFARKTHKKLDSLFHIESQKQQEDRQVGIDFLQQFMAFIFSDKQISDSIFKGKPLSDQSGGRIKNFFVSNQPFVDLLVQLLDEDPKAPKCYLSLQENKKRKIITTIIKQYDFVTLINSDSSQQSHNQDQFEKIRDKIKNDPDLGSSVLDCLNKNPTFLLLAY